MGGSVPSPGEPDGGKAPPGKLEGVLKTSVSCLARARASKTPSKALREALLCVASPKPFCSGSQTAGTHGERGREAL
jgi:hypothetical protein